ncbi:MAG: UTP--glucose-1-phosphate uridylyltransferase GalU [Gammaproteobacteria bacterium TMED225]|nr:MAG: UTP--glucose-1-phosphate uridylyltransferase GalU [Gammaproteobacteria bacterium TMED225]|tara:strand:- start:629 stop:1504 length:876 start_codon:yes stop_codon:yes gene_type:complete
MRDLKLIKKAVLPVAGLGTRFLPASKAVPKEMLPIIDKPLLQYAVEEAIESGIKEIIFITNPEKISIKKHFENNHGMETKLINSGKTDLAQKVNPYQFSKIKFHYINQDEQNGLGHAILQAERLIENQPFAVLLPDDLFHSKKSCLNQLLDIYIKTKASVLALNKVDEIDIHKYGVIKPGATDGNTIKIDDIVEKPNFENAPSDIAVSGRYILNPTIFKYLKSTKSDLNGEIQLTDAIKLLLEVEEVYGKVYEGQKFDCGSKKGFVHATIALALKDETLKEDIKNIIKDIF